MKRNFWLFMTMGLLMVILGVALWTFWMRTPSPSETLPATVSRDCAPWDGAAFTVSIPHESGLIIYISIWQSPEFNFPRTFSFPDDTGQVGNAYILPELDPLETLSGRVTFQRVQVGMPVEGRFSLRSERGGVFEGQFQAEWDDQIIMCG